MGVYLPSQQVPLLVKPPPFQWSPDDIEDPIWRAIARDMSVFCPVWFGGAECLNLIDGVDIPRATSTDVYGEGDIGFGISTTTDIECFKTTANYSPVKTSDGVGTGDFCFITYAAPLASSAKISVPIAQREATSPFPQADLAFNAAINLAVSSGSVAFFTHNGSSTRMAVAGLVDGSLALWRAQRTGTKIDIYKDHDQSGSTTGTVRDIHDGATQQFAIGAQADATSGRFKGDLYYSANVERALSDDEWHHIVDNPLGIFQRRERRIYFVPAGGGVFNESLALAASAGVAAAGGLVMAPGATLPANAGLAAAGLLAMEEAATLAAAAGLAASGGLLVTGSLTLDAFAGMTATGGLLVSGSLALDAFAGAAVVPTIAFGPALTLGGSAAMAAASAIDFGAALGLDAVAAVQALGTLVMGDTITMSATVTAAFAEVSIGTVTPGTATLGDGGPSASTGDTGPTATLGGNQ